MDEKEVIKLASRIGLGIVQYDSKYNETLGVEDSSIHNVSNTIFAKDRKKETQKYLDDSIK